MKDLLLFVKDLPLGPVERTLLDSILAGDPNNVQMKRSTRNAPATTAPKPAL